MPKPPELATNEALSIEETLVTAVSGFPPKVVLQLLLANGEIVSGHLGPMQAHKLSDDLLRAVAMVKRGEHCSESERPRE
jgi:hypothetical protein